MSFVALEKLSKVKQENSWRVISDAGIHQAEEV